MPVTRRGDTFFIAAGEHSGDLLGAELAAALREQLPRFQQFGIAGDAMTSAGVTPIEHISSLNVMGFWEVAKAFGHLRMFEQRVIAEVLKRNAKFALFVDNPGLNLRLAEQLTMHGIPCYQYVAPKIWAWNEKRAPRLKATYKKVFGILSFEESTYKKHDIPYEYVGSPIKDRVEKVIVQRDQLGFSDESTLFAMLPGSRKDEIRRILPLFEGIAQIVKRSIPNAQFIVPVSDNIPMEWIESLMTSSSIHRSGLSFTSGNLSFLKGMSWEAMACADAALVASGTATLECGLFRTPLSVIYCMSDLTYQIASRVVKLPYVSLVNLVAGKEIVREFIQDFSLSEVAADLVDLIENPSRRQDVINELEDIYDSIEGGAAIKAAKSLAKDFC